MPQKEIGPSFFDDLTGHGGLVGGHFGWDAQGNLYFFDDTPKAVSDGVKAVYAAHDPNKPSWSTYRASAQTALADSDITVLRCYENSIAVPPAWADYRKALRAIISAESGDSTLPLPVQPPYPEGS
jgi:hypothetical protein